MPPQFNIIYDTNKKEKTQRYNRANGNALYRQ